MGISYSAKSKAAAVSALIKRDAGFRVTPSGSTRDQGIRVRSGGGSDEYPSIQITDPFESINDASESDRLVEYRRHNICKALDARGYGYTTIWIDGDHFCTILVISKGAPVKKVEGRVEHQVKLSFTIDLAAARRYLGDSYTEDDRENALARVVGAAIEDMIGASEAYNMGAITVTGNEFVR